MARYRREPDQPEPEVGDPPPRWLARWMSTLAAEAVANGLRLIADTEAGRRARALWSDLPPDVRRRLTERET